MCPNVSTHKNVRGKVENLALAQRVGPIIGPGTIGETSLFVPRLKLIPVPSKAKNEVSHGPVCFAEGTYIPGYYMYVCITYICMTPGWYTIEV